MILTNKQLFYVKVTTSSDLLISQKLNVAKNKIILLWKIEKIDYQDGKIRLKLIMHQKKDQNWFVIN